MKKIFFYITAPLLFVFISFTHVHAHCEIPCGIYDDEMRINMISEHITTIEKAINTIIALEKEDHHHYNQLVRWIVNKEEHATELQWIVSQYFMTQRIKKDAKNYEKMLSILHQMLVYSMKCKQTTDLSNITALQGLVEDFEDLYFKKE